MSLFGLLLSACGPSEQEAGLTGGNPVVGVVFRRSGSFIPFSSELSISSKGALTFDGGYEENRRLRRQKSVMPTAFRQAALKLGSHRVGPSEFRMVSGNCYETVLDGGSRSIKWIYANGQVGTLSIGGCKNRETDELNHIIQTSFVGLAEPAWDKEASDLDSAAR